MKKQDIPIALAGPVLFDLLGVDVKVTGLCEETGKMLSRGGSSVGQALVIAVIGLVRTGH